jgi:hypothetical protein
MKAVAIQSLLLSGVVVAMPETRPLRVIEASEETDIIIINGWVLLKSDLLHYES